MRRREMPSSATIGTANLQPPRLTVAEAAKIMKVSERAVYMVRAVTLRRPDLVAALAAGTMRISTAYTLAVGKQKLSGFDKLVKTWNAAKDSERLRFLRQLDRQMSQEWP